MSRWKAAGIVAVLGLSCATAGLPARDELVNGSFEDGRDPWYDFRDATKPFWGTFSISEAIAYDGAHSLHLALDSDDFARARNGMGIAGAAQDVAVPEHFPKRLSGRYRVESWERGTAKQYVQLVVMAFQPENFPEMGALPVQLSIVLTGVDAPPVEIANRRFVFEGPAEPELGRWIPFDIDLQEAFRSHWGRVPEGVIGLRVVAEARFDDYRRGRDRHARADVYLDALHLGD